MKFKNETDYSLKSIKAFNLYHINHRFLSYVIIGLLFLLMAISLGNFIVYKSYDYLIYVGLYILILISNFILNYFIVSFSSKLLLKKDTFIDKAVNQFTFYESDFEVNDGQDVIRLPYERILKVKKNKHYIFLYISFNTAFILERQKFSKGNDLEFLSFVKEKRK